MFSGACKYPGNDFPDNIYLFKVKDWNTEKRCEICLKLTMKAPERTERRQWRRSGVSTADFVQVNVS